MENQETADDITSEYRHMLHSPVTLKHVSTMCKCCLHARLVNGCCHAV